MLVAADMGRLGGAGGHIANYVDEIYEPSGADWNCTVHDFTDEEWAHLEPLLPTYSGPGKLGRPTKWSKRDIVNAILYVTGTGCQWRALPVCYPPWKTVHGYHRMWSHDGTWAQICDHLRALVRDREGRDPEPSAVVIDARSVQGAATVGGETRGYDAGKKVSGRKVFTIVDTVGLLVAVIVVAANVSENVGGIERVDVAAPKSGRLTKIWTDAGFKKEFAKLCSPSPAPPPPPHHLNKIPRNALDKLFRQPLTPAMSQKECDKACWDTYNRFARALPVNAYGGYCHCVPSTGINQSGLSITGTRVSP